METAGEGTHDSKRLHIRDIESGITFLVDTGADISLLPVDKKSKMKPAKFKLFAVNDTRIDTFGEKRLVLNFNLRRPFVWNFCVAAVPYPIIGADLLNHFGLLVDLRRDRLIHPLTSIFAKGIVRISPLMRVSFLDKTSKYFVIFSQFPEIIGPSVNKFRTLGNVHHHIITDGSPVAEHARRLAPDKLKMVKEEFSYLMAQGVCRPSSSPWASPIHLVLKKDGSNKICGDYRRLNAITVPDKYPVPHLYDFSVHLRGSTIFSKIDFYKAYYQIPVAPEDIPKTAVITPFGLFEYTVMPFGLRNASQTFQKYVNGVFVDLNFVFVYIDDILVASSNVEEHEAHLRIVCQRLKEYFLRINPVKCEFGKSELVFLGYLVNSQGLKPTAERTEAITKFPKPKTIVQLRKFLGMVNFYRRNLPNAAKIQAPLYVYITDSKKNDKREIAWTTEAVNAFELTKKALVDATLLSHPSFDAETRLVTDASDFSMGAALEQNIDGSWKPLAFFSRKFSSTQVKYSTYDRELTAVYESIRVFKYFLKGRNFRIVTDHKPLIYAFRQRADKASPRQRRQLSYISQFTSCFEYLAGSDNIVADPLSRVDSIRLPAEFDLLELSRAQSVDPELKALKKSSAHSLTLKCIEWGPDHCKIYCDLTGETLRPFIPLVLRKKVFDMFHQPAHGAAKVTDQTIRKRYVWPNMHRDVKSWR